MLGQVLIKQTENGYFLKVEYPGYVASTFAFTDHKIMCEWLGATLPILHSKFVLSMRALNNTREGEKKDIPLSVHKKRDGLGMLKDILGGYLPDREIQLLYMYLNDPENFSHK
jgi:hypothetical protein